MNRKTLGLYFLISSIAAANEWGLQDILKKVDKGNPEVRIKEIETGIKKIEKNKSLKDLILPSIAIKSEDEWNIVKDEGLDFNRIDATIDVFEGGRSYYTYKKSNVNYNLAKKEEVITKVDAQQKAVNEYFKYLNYKNQKNITEMTIDALEKQYSRLYNLYKTNNLVSKSEVLKVEADMENNRSESILLKQQEDSAYEALLRVLGMNVKDKIKFKEFTPEKFSLEKYNLKEGESKIGDTTLGQIAKMRVQGSEYDVGIARAALYPTAYVGYENVFNSRYEDDPYEKGETITLGVRWDFNWGMDWDTVQQSKMNLKQENIRYEDRMNELNLQVRDRFRNMGSLYGQITAQRKRVESLKENLRIDNMRYDNQLISTFDYLNSVNSLKKAQEDYYTLERDLVFAIIEYENLFK